MMRTTLNYFLDILMFVVPILELTEMVAVIPVEYLPFYMLGTVILRRGARLLEDYLDRNSTNTTG